MRTRARVSQFVTNDTKFRFGIHGVTNKQVVSAIIQSIIRFITTELQQGRRVQIGELGTFLLSHRKGHIIDEKIEHPEADYAMFRPSPTLKKRIWEVRKPIWKNKTDKPICPK
jgi:nucleoid DNA-binding protein